MLLLLACAPALPAGLYSIHEKCPFKIRSDGTAEELSYLADMPSAFALEYAYYGNVGDDRFRKTPGEPAGKQNKDYLDVLARTKPPLASSDPVSTASRAADLVRIRKYDDALNTLAPLATQRRPDFRVMANLAHIHAFRKEWGEAVRRHEAALEDCEFPADLTNATPEQRAWLQRVEKDYYRKWLHIHEKEAREKLPPNRETVFPLFGDRPPADAIAIVQQLLLWYPDDNRLYWLLADLYSKSNRPRQALKLYNSLAGEDRLYANRTKMMERRAAVKRIVDALPPETPPEEAVISPLPTDVAPDQQPWMARLGLSLTKLLAAGGVFVVLALLLMILQIRKVMRS